MNTVFQVDQKSTTNLRSNEIAVKPVNIVNDVTSCEEVADQNSTVPPKPSKWKIVQAANHILPKVSKGELKLNRIIDDLKKFSVEEGKSSTMTTTPTGARPFYWIECSRQRLKQFLLQTRFHYLIIILVLTDLIVVLVDLVLAQLSSPCLTDDEMAQYNITNQRDTCLLPLSDELHAGESFLFYFSLGLLILFVVEVILSFYAFGWRHYTNILFFLDALIVLTSFIMEIYFHFGNIGRAGRAAAAIVILRLWKIVRAIHAVAHSITMKNRLLIKHIQEAQTVIEAEKKSSEILLEKQQIQLEYLIELLRKQGKYPSIDHIEKYAEKVWHEKNQSNAE